METGAAMMIGMILVYVVMLGLSIAWFVFMIIIMIKANKALSIWIRKNDDMQPPPPPYPTSYPVPPAQTDFNENER